MTTTNPLRVQVPTANLLRELRWVAQALPKPRQLSKDDLGLTGVLLEAVPGGVRLTGSDGTTVLTSTLPAAGASGRSLLPGKQLVELVAAIGRGDTVIQPEPEKKRSQVIGAGVTYNVPGLDAYPELPAGPETDVAVLPQDATARLASAVYAMGVDYTLPVLAAACLHVHDGHLAVACTDRYRLALLSDLAVTGAPADAQWIVPSSAFRFAVKGLARLGPVVVSASLPSAELEWPGPETRRPKSVVRFAAGGRTVQTLGVDADYPKVRGLTEGTRDWSVEVDRAELMEAVRQVAVIAHRNDPVRLVPGAAALTVSVDMSGHDGEHASTATRDVPATYGDGAAAPRMAFNPGYLIDSLKAATGERVRITGPEMPAKHLTKPVLILGDDKAAVHLLMPVRLAG